MAVTTTATSLTLDTPAQTTPDTPIILTGTYQGDPQALDYNFGAGWVEASSATFSDGTYSFTVPGGVALGSYLPEVRDDTAISVTASAGAFVVSDWTPETLQASPGATAVFEFNANDPAVAPGTDGAAIGSVINSLDSAQSLTAVRASDGNPVVVAYDSGADGDSRVLQFDPTTINPNIYDPSTNWLDAGGVDGPAGSALVDLANSSDLATNGSFTTVIAVDVSKSYTYEAGPIWGSLASPGPLQYVQLRINNGSDEQGADLTDSSEDTINAQRTVTAGWHVMTMIKDASLLIYRLDGVVVQTSDITSTKPFTASDFLIGGGFPQGSTADLSQENGVPTPDIGEFQAYGGVLQGTDLTNAEALAGNSIGVPLPSGDIASQVIWLPETPTSYAAAAGDTVNGGAGAATVTAAAGSVVVNGGSGSLWFIGGSASSTVSGGAGLDTVIGGDGGGVFSSGSAGGSVLVASGGNTSLTGSGAGDELFGAASGSDVMVAASTADSLIGGGGSTTMTGGATSGAVIFTDGDTTVNGGAAGADTVVGGSGALSVNARLGDAIFGGSGALDVAGSAIGSDSIVGGSGALSVHGNRANMLVVAGSSTSDIDTGDGASLIFSGSGPSTITGGSGSMQVLLGSGTATISEGAGRTVYDVVKGDAGGTDVLAGFRPDTDTIDLFGYKPSDIQVVTVAGSTLLALADGSRITLLGVGDPGTSITA